MKEVVVASIPRSGSTYLYRSICGLPAKDTTPKGDAYEKLPAIKTHGLYPVYTFGDPRAASVEKHMADGGKVIFIYSDPYYAVPSTRQRRWDQYHAANCGCFTDINRLDIYASDVFHYELMFDTWTGARTPNVLTVKYETLNENKIYVEAFLGREVKWLPWRGRSGLLYNNDETAVRKMETTYKRLHDKWLAAPAITKG